MSFMCGVGGGGRDVLIQCTAEILRRARGGGEGSTHSMHSRSRMTIWYRPSHPYYTGTEHVEFSPTRQTPRAPSAKRREVLGESHDG